jgi:PIN domain nuclease of toxin-antitoxin system
LISAVVVWEIAIKRRLGKLDAPADRRCPNRRSKRAEAEAGGEPL